MKIKSVILMALAYLFLPIFCVLASEKELGSNKRPLSFGSDQTIVDLHKISWKPLKIKGFSKGAEIAVVRGDMKAAGSESILRLPPNYKVPSHSHTSDELYVWIEGTFTLISHDGAKTIFNGPAYISFPGNAPPHALRCGPKQSCLLYLRLSRPFDIKYPTNDAQSQ